MILSLAAYLTSVLRTIFRPTLVLFLLIGVFGNLPLWAQSQDTTPSPDSLKKMSLEQLMNLDVTSVAKKAEPYAEAPAAIQVVTNEQIMQFGASSIPEALRLASNLDVAQASSSAWDISARGFNAGLANKLLVLMDGRTIYTPLDAGVFWNAQDYLMVDIDRIEVISGPGGTLWGDNAVNGVINITTKSAKDTQGGYVETGGGNWLEDFAGARYGGALDSNTFYRVYGKYFDRGAENLTYGSNASDAWRMGQGGFRLDSDSSSEEHWTLQGDMYGSSLNTASTPNTPQNYNGGNALGRWTHNYADDSSASLQVYYDRTNFYDPVAASTFGAAGVLTDTLDTYDIDFQHRLHIDTTNEVTWGLGYRFTHDLVQNAPALAFYPTILDHQLFSGFAQDELHLASTLSFTFGTKIQHNDYTGYDWEPSARLKWDLTDDQMLWASVSRAVRAPSRIDRDFMVPNSATPFLEGGPSFQSEVVVAYELGYRAQLMSDFSTSLSTFFNNYDNLRGLAALPGTATPIYINNDLYGQTGGGELTADWQVTKNCLLHLGYDLLIENIQIKPGNTDMNNGLGDTSDPPNQVFARASLEVGNWEFAPAFRWIDARTIVNGTTVGSVANYAELDTRVAWHPFKDLELSVIGQNLLQDSHPEYGYPSSTQEAIVRSVYGKVAWKL